LPGFDKPAASRYAATSAAATARGFRILVPGAIVGSDHFD
jgi:hypothetical protein